MAHGANIIDSRIRDARVPWWYFPKELSSPSSSFSRPSIVKCRDNPETDSTRSSSSSSSSPPPFLYRFLLSGMPRIPRPSNSSRRNRDTVFVHHPLLVRSDNGSPYRMYIYIYMYVCVCVANSFEKLQVGKREPRNRRGAKRGPDLKLATARKFDWSWNSWGWHGRRTDPFHQSRSKGEKARVGRKLAANLCCRLIPN